MKKKIIISLTLVCMILTVIVGLTYAYWTKTAVQEGVNVVNSSCFDISFTGENDISLPNAYPIRDEEGYKLIPYTFTITNTCDLWASYQINLETFPAEPTQKRMPDNYIKANLKQGNINKFNDTLNEDIKVNSTITGATDAYKLVEGVLRNGSSRTYNLRLWMDEGVTLDDVDSIKASFKSKISVSFSVADEPTIESGMIQERQDSKFWKYEYRNNITDIVFQNKLEPISTDLSWDVSALNDGSVMAYLVPNENTSNRYTLYLQGNDGIKANLNSSYLFSSFSNLLSITGLQYFDTSSAIDMSDMFYNCYNLESLDLSSFDTSNVTNMKSMFYYCHNLESLDLSSFDTSNVTNMSYMFSLCSVLTSLDVSNFDTSNVTDMSWGFNECKALNSLDVSNFDTSNVTNMDNLFSSCEKLKELNVSSFNTSKVTNMRQLFYACKELTELDVSNFDTSNVTMMNFMFSSCNKLTYLDLTNFNTHNNKEFGAMFYECSNLKKVNLSSFDFSSAKNLYGLLYLSNIHMFYKSPYIETELNLNANANVDISFLVYNSATESGSQIIVNYTEDIETALDNLIANNPTCNIIKGHLLGNSVTITSEDVTANFSKATEGKVVTLSSSERKKIVSFKVNGNIIEGNTFTMPSGSVTISDVQFLYKHDIQIPESVTSNEVSAFEGELINLTQNDATKTIKSFKLNGTLIIGDSFTMPDNDAIITDVVFSDIIVIESNHNPYQMLNEETIIYENSFDSDATSLTLIIDYATSNTNYAPIKIYNNPSSVYRILGGCVNNSSNGTTREELTIPGNYLKVTFKNTYMPYYYGFKITVIQNFTETKEKAVVESHHKSYDNNLSNFNYFEKTYEGAKSITVELTYQTENIDYDYVRLYTSENTIYNNQKFGGLTEETETITIPSNYIKITFTTNNSGDYYYGFKAVITPNYD